MNEADDPTHSMTIHSPPRTTRSDNPSPPGDSSTRADTSAGAIASTAPSPASNGTSPSASAASRQPSPLVSPIKVEPTDQDIQDSSSDQPIPPGPPPVSDSSTQSIPNVRSQGTNMKVEFDDGDPNFLDNPKASTDSQQVPRSMFDDVDPGFLASSPLKNSRVPTDPEQLPLSPIHPLADNMHDTSSRIVTDSPGNSSLADADTVADALDSHAGTADTVVERRSPYNLRSQRRRAASADHVDTPHPKSSQPQSANASNVPLLDFSNTSTL